MNEFPTHPAAVTAEWLTERLRDGGQLDGGRVTSVDVAADRHRPSRRQRALLARRTTGGAGPATLAGKFPAADPTSRGTAAAFGLYAKEVGFYRELAPQLDVRVPRTLRRRGR